MNTFTLITKEEVRSCMGCPYVNEPARECNISGDKLEHPYWIPDDCSIKGCEVSV